MEGPGPKKDTRGGSRGALSKPGIDGGGVAYSELTAEVTVETGRSSAMAGGKEEVDGWEENNQGKKG
jgi:hypothetical protein